LTVVELPRRRPSLFAPVAFAAWLVVTATWWALAFAPLPVPADWLERARAVCFGTLPNGLPDDWGWMLLLLGPLSMFGFLLAVWGRDLGSAIRRVARRPDGLLLLVIVALAAAGSLFWVGGRVAAARAASAALTPAGGEPLAPDYPRGLDPAPALGLVDQAGARIGVDSLAGRPALVTFAYAHCVAVCPILVGTLHRASERLADGPAPAVVIVTLDPWRDTPGSLPTIAEGWGLDRLTNAHALSGTVDEVEAVREHWNVAATRDESTGDIVHPGIVFVVDAEGRLAYRFLNPPAEWLVDAVQRLDRSPA